MNSGISNSPIKIIEISLIAILDVSNYAINNGQLKQNALCLPIAYA